MKRMRRPPPTPWSRFRPFLLPAIAVLVFVMLFTADDFDVDALREHFARGNVEAALASLDAAPPDDLPPSLADVTFWDLERRRDALGALARKSGDELFESPDHVTIVAPLGRHRAAPAEIVFREAVDEPLVAELTHIEMRLQADTIDVPAGAERVPIDATLLPGGGYSVFVRRADEQRYVAVDAFEILSSDEVAAVETALATARELADDAHAGDLLAAQVALHHGLHEFARELLVPLEDVPAHARAARELRAIAFERSGLDVTARRLAGTVAGR